MEKAVFIYLWGTDNITYCVFSTSGSGFVLLVTKWKLLAAAENYDSFKKLRKCMNNEKWWYMLPSNAFNSYISIVYLLQIFGVNLRTHFTTKLDHNI